MAWVLAPKALLVSTGVALVGLALRLSLPFVLEFSSSHLPLVWASLLSWLKPPYLFFIVNGIIVGIAVTSRFHHNHHHDGAERQVPVDDPPPLRPTEEISSEFNVYHLTDATHQQKREEAMDEVSELTKAVVVMNGYAEAEEEEDDDDDDDDDDDEAVGWKSTGNQTKRSLHSSETQLTEYLSPAEKPLVSARFGHRKPVKASPAGGSGRTLRVAKPKRHETMENTWKAIMERRTLPLSRHMRKCDTWENHGRRQIDLLEDPSPVKKSETFKDRTNLQQTPSPGSSNSRLRKEPSLSQEELNRRAEEFINKFNEDMRLQRQESLNQYMEMINRGAGH